MIGRSEKWLSLLLHPHLQRKVGNKDAHVLTTGTDLREGTFIHCSSIGCACTMCKAVNVLGIHWLHGAL